MENDKLTDQLIDEFIMGLLNKKDDRAFRQRMEMDLDLAEQVKLRREIISGVEAFGRKTFKQELKDIHTEVIDQKASPAKRRSLLPYIAAAASVLVLVIALYWMMNDNGKISPEEIYIAAFKAPDISIAQRAEGNEQLLTLEQLYKNKDYQAALPLFEAELKNTPTSNLLLGAGIAALESDQVEKALSYFKQITEKGDFNFENEVSWYSGLAYLKLGDVDEAKNALRPLVVVERADHHEEAIAVMKALE